MKGLLIPAVWTRGEEDGGSMIVWGRDWSPKEVAEGPGRAVWRSYCLVEREKMVSEAIREYSVYHVDRVKKAQEVQGSLLSLGFARGPL